MAAVLLNIQVVASQRLMQMLNPGKRVALGGIAKLGIKPRRSVSTRDVYAYYSNLYKQSEQKINDKKDEISKKWQEYHALKKERETLKELLARIDQNNPSLVATRVNSHTAYIDVPEKGRSYFPTFARQTYQSNSKAEGQPTEPRKS